MLLDLGQSTPTSKPSCRICFVTPKLAAAAAYSPVPRRPHFASPISMVTGECERHWHAMCYVYHGSRCGREHQALDDRQLGARRSGVNFFLWVIGFADSHLPHRVFAKVKVVGLLGLPRCDGLARIANRLTRNCEATILLTSARFGSRASSSWLAKIMS